MSDRTLLFVLAYHRITEPGPGFVGHRRLVSASPRSFRSQLRWLRSQIPVITGEDLLAFVEHGDPLPRTAAMVTFDDGYRDTAEEAAPLIEETGATGVLFVTTGWVDGEIRLFWDVAAECFATASRPQGRIPLLGSVHWDRPEARLAVETRWIELAKQLTPDERSEAVAELGAALGSDVDLAAIDALRMSWGDVRDLRGHGWTIGAHTVRHPVLTTLDDADAGREIGDAMARVAEELGAATRSFAYPNGGEADFTPAHEAMVADAGGAVAFSLLPGPQRGAEVRSHPLAVRRILISRHDSMPRFVAKLAGAQRIARRFLGGR